MYNLDENIYLTGHGRTHENNPITKLFICLYMGLLVNKKTGEIIEVDATVQMDLTKKVISEIFYGKNILDEEEIIEKINKFYFASSQKALIIAYKECIHKFKKNKDL
ncbi:DUF3870 domain-containing protein [uncultured Ilyobacter sp.]|uniref:DUF3870 domain-containing protein n=1 Tax=uncultured Ilyobacter sp. TaxID=544433 RepID=UPI0029C6925D|nr:DUF3870 domain-containing protein [uncultured Ilyobacter sp.]